MKIEITLQEYRYSAKTNQELNLSIASHNDKEVRMIVADPVKGTLSSIDIDISTLQCALAKLAL